MGLRPTPTEHDVPLRAATFSTLAEALDYAAQGHTGCNFYGDRGDLRAVMTYADLRDQAWLLAARLLSLGLERGLGLWHPSNGEWYTNKQGPATAVVSTQLGDIPVPANYSAS